MPFKDGIDDWSFSIKATKLKAISRLVNCSLIMHPVTDFNFAMINKTYKPVVTLFYFYFDSIVMLDF